MSPPLSSLGTITAANAVLMLSQDLLAPDPVQIQGFGTDDVYSTEQVKAAEVAMGVDGFMSAGFVYNEVKQTFTLQADSLSNDFFDMINAQSRAGSTVYPLSGLIILPGIATKFRHIRGVLTMYQPIPDAKKILQVRKYEVTWQEISPSPT